MTWVVPLGLGGVAIIMMAVFTMLSARKHQQGAAMPATVVGPRVLVHDINDDRCTGCDACVAVCPTNVLDLVANKSRVLRFEDCIQCEACMYACPTEALVMFPEDTAPPPLKVPAIDEHFETEVAGQYLIGEVAGKPLVKNAANLGRAVIEHMLAQGMRVGAIGKSETTVDVVIVGSGPGGISAALTCVQRGVSYVVLEKEHLLASTISRYPKGKLVMAEPYDTANLSLLPVFDSTKEQLIPIWREVLDRVGVDIRQGESVEAVVRKPDGVFETTTTTGVYHSQRVVLSIGTRGKPRTLGVRGENRASVFSLLEDPDDWAQRAVLVVGGGDSACEAALALADAGARVIMSYRGKNLARAAPKNRQSVEQYAGEGRIKLQLGSQVLEFGEVSVTLAHGDGTQKEYANDAAFVLIGADPPVQWLEKLGVKFVERPHQYAMGKTDDIVRRWVTAALECPRDAMRATAQVLGKQMEMTPAAPFDIETGNDQRGLTPPVATAPVPPPTKGPRKWLRSATSLFSTKLGTAPGIPRARSPISVGPAQTPGMPPPAPGMPPPRPTGSKKFDAPVPLSEFAKRKKQPSAAKPGARAGTHTGDGRRDALSAGERTRILRMLRDEGGRMADEDSRVYIGAAPPNPHEFDLDDPVAPPPFAATPTVPPLAKPKASPAAGRTRAPTSIPPPLPPSAVQAAPTKPKSAQLAAPRVTDAAAKPAMVVGLARAQAEASSRKRSGRTAAPPGPAPAKSVRAPGRSTAPPPLAPPVDETPPPAVAPRARPLSGRRSKGPAFSSEPTRPVDDDLLARLRAEVAKTPPRAAAALPKGVAKAPPDRPTIASVPNDFSDGDATAFDSNPHGSHGSHGSHAVGGRSLPFDESEFNDEATQMNDGVPKESRGGDTAKNARIGDVDWDID